MQHMMKKRVCWITASAGEASIALPASRVLATNGIETSFASALDESIRFFAAHKTPVCYIRAHLPPAPRRLTPAQLDELDRRYSPPGIISLMYAESKACHLRDSNTLLPLTLRYLAFWEQFLEQERADAVIMWQSTSLPSRSMWAVAHAHGLPHLIMVNGPSLDHLTLADISEEAIWSELLEVLNSEAPHTLTPEQRLEALALVGKVTRLHSKFKPRPTSIMPPPIIQDMTITARLSLRALQHRLSASNSTPATALPLIEEHLQQQAIQRDNQWRRFRWAWLTRLRLLTYTRPDFTQPYIYFPMQNEVDVKLSTRNALYNDQTYLARLIARAVPPGYKLYVKEHPNHPGMYRWKDLKQLQQIANVELIHPHADNVQLIRNAGAVIVISSTAGWEGYLWQVPVVSLGGDFCSHSRLVFSVGSLNDLRMTLRAALSNGRSQYARQSEEWLWFIWQVIATSHAGSAFGYRVMFNAIGKKESQANGAVIGTGLSEKLLRLFSAAPATTLATRRDEHRVEPVGRTE